MNNSTVRKSIKSAAKKTSKSNLVITNGILYFIYIIFISLIIIGFMANRYTFTANSLLGYLGLILLGTIILVFITSIINFNLKMSALSLARGNKVVIEETLFNAFKVPKRYLLSIAGSLVYGLCYGLIGSFPLAGFFAMAAFAIYFLPALSIYHYLIIDPNKNLSAADAAKEALRIIEGHRIEFLALQISFLFYDLLNILTIGLASIYVNAYKELSYANFYLYITQEKEFLKANSTLNDLALLILGYVASFIGVLILIIVIATVYIVGVETNESIKRPTYPQEYTYDNNYI